jgi:hypothetical protein
VCVNPKALDTKWRKVAAVKLADLEARNAQWGAIKTESAAALREVERLLTRPPSVLRTAGEAGIAIGALPAAWARFVTAPDSADMIGPAHHLADASQALDHEAAEVRLNLTMRLLGRGNVPMGNSRNKGRFRSQTHYDLSIGT